MADKNVGIAMVLSAKNQATVVLDEFFNKTEAKMKALGQATVKIGEGMAEIMAAKKGVDMLEKTVDAFADVQEAQIKMRTTMMGQGGILDEGTFKKLTNYAEYISDNFTGTQASYTQMFQELMRNRIDPKLILGGLGEQVAKLGVVLDTEPATIAEFTAHMINDAGVKLNQARDVMDMVARFSDMGVGKTGSEAVTAMTEYFGQASLGMKTLGWQGVQATKTVGLIGSMFIAMGLNAGTVGTNVRRMEDSLRSVSKMNQVKKAAAMVGVKLDFFDKNGKPLGPENMIKQLEKLKGQSVGTIEAILKPMGGKKGLSTDFVEAIASGEMDFDKFKKQYEAKADFEQKYNERMKGLKKQEEVISSNMRNALARIGMALAPTFAKILGIMNRVILTMKNFAKEHPKLVKIAAAFVAIGSAALALMGVINIIRGVVVVARLLNMTLMMNPIVLIAAAIIGAAVLIYTYWDNIKAFFVKVWAGLTAVFSSAWNWFKNSFFIYFTPFVIFKYWKPLGSFFKGVWDIVKVLFEAAYVGVKWMLLNMTPAGLIYKYWKPLAGFFGGIWDAVKGPFKDIFDWVWKWGSMFADAGKHIVDSIIGGIMDKVGAVGAAMQRMAAKIRAYLPFSPAKEGALRDIHRIRLVETVAASIKPGAMVQAWSGAISALRGAMNSSTPIPVAAGAAGGMGPVNFSVTVNLSGGATSADAGLISDAMRVQFKKMMDDYAGQRLRKGF